VPPGAFPRAFRVLLIAQAVAALVLGAFAIAQEEPRLPHSLGVAGSLGRLSSAALYALACAVSLGAALSPGFRRALGAPFHERARGILGVLALAFGILSSAVLLFHAAAGDVWWSARVTPFRHPDPVPYLAGAAALGAAMLLVLLMGETFLEKVFEGRTAALRVSRRIAILLFALACGFILAEAGLRVYAVILPRTDGLGVTPGAELWMRRYVRLNRAGFRDEEPAPRAPGELLVAVLGDSLVFGYGIERTGYRATERLEALLAERLPSLSGDASGRRQARVVNIALPGAGPRRQLEWLKDVALPLSPDVVVLGHFWNDIRGAAAGEVEPEEDDAAGERPQWHTFRRRVRVWIQSQSALGAQVIKARLLIQERRRDPAEPIVRAYGDPPVYARHLDILEAMHRLAAASGVRFVILLLPDFGYPFAESPYATIGARMEDDLKKRGVAAHDLVRLVPPPFRGGKDLWVNAGDSHPNEAGHAYIADGLLRVVVEACAREAPVPRR
jgi:lysophospholipase L1-like esterase